MKSPEQKGSIDASDWVLIVLRGFLRCTAINSRDYQVRLNNGFADRENVGLVCRVFVCLSVLPWYLPCVVVPSTSVAGMIRANSLAREFSSVRYMLFDFP